MRSYGVYVPGADTRIFRVLPPEKGGDDGEREGDSISNKEEEPLPVVLVAVHYAYRHPAAITDNLQSAAAHEQIKGLRLFMMSRVWDRIRQWNDPRFERCLVWIFTPDVDDFFYLGTARKNCELISLWDAIQNRREGSMTITFP